MSSGSRKASKKDTRSRSRLPAIQLRKVSSEHVRSAVRRLLTEQVNHSFGPSTDFDLIVPSGERLPPKAVFGLAATEALGSEILPGHFTGGVGTLCFRILQEAGFQIVPKEAEPVEQAAPISDEDREWIEGRPKLISHLRRERAPGLAKAKREAFLREHKRLYCERCELDPVVAFGSAHGLSCIEVHHRNTQVKDMKDEHSSKLEDLMCVCANCHRIIHSELRNI